MLVYISVAAACVCFAALGFAFYKHDAEKAQFNVKQSIISAINSASFLNPALCHFQEAFLVRSKDPTTSEGRLASQQIDSLAWALERALTGKINGKWRGITEPPEPASVSQRFKNKLISAVSRVSDEALDTFKASVEARRPFDANQCVLDALTLYAVTLRDGKAKVES